MNTVEIESWSAKKKWGYWDELLKKETLYSHILFMRRNNETTVYFCLKKKMGVKYNISVKREKNLSLFSQTQTQ